MYIEQGPIFSFTKFDTEGFDLRPASPIITVVSGECADELSFGGECSADDEASDEASRMMWS